MRRSVRGVRVAVDELAVRRGVPLGVEVLHDSPLQERSGLGEKRKQVVEHTQLVGHTSVAGHFTTPTLVLRPVPDPYAALQRYRLDLVERGWAADGPVPQARWWREPAFCGWGAQCARAPLPGRPR